MIKLLFILIINIIAYIIFGGAGIIIFTLTGFLNYFIGKNLSKKKQKLVLIIGILISITPLIYLKYINITSMIVPLGISYYTLQMISFIVDAYKGKYEIKNDFIEYLLYMYYIPCMFIGPINRYDDLAHQLKNDIRIKSENLYYGFYRITIGLFKKIMIANGIAVLIKTIASNTSSYYGFYVLFAVLAYSIQLYADFSGATDMIIGISKIFNIDIKENFKEPYLSQSISEFWRRWHMTLGSWLRDYIYIPIGGNRCGKIRKSFNLIVTFTVSGLWHGMNYLVWGLIHGILCALNIKTKNKYFNIVLNYILVSLLWIFFIYPNTYTSLEMMYTVFTSFNILDFVNNILNLGLGIFELIVLLISIIMLIIYDLNKDKIENSFSNILYDKKILLILMLGLIIIVFGFYGIGFNGNDFIYSKF